MSNSLIKGLHHVTAMSSDAQENLDFYTGVLGMRLVKKTINFDSPNVYHFYFGDEGGTPGSIMTFFPIPGLRRGRKGPGQLTITSFSIAKDAVNYWKNRLERFSVSFNEPYQRFNKETVIYLEDNEGLGVELVANDVDDRKGYSSGPVPAEFSIKGFYSVTFHSENPLATANLLTNYMDYALIAESRTVNRYGVNLNPVSFVDILKNPSSEYQAAGGSGTVHHVAFATPGNDEQLQVSQIVRRSGIQVTDVRDRQYFNSIYFREPGGILFEVATNPPGFLIDEPLDNLGEHLKLPQWEEKNRTSIERELPDIKLNVDKYKD